MASRQTNRATQTKKKTSASGNKPAATRQTNKKSTTASSSNKGSQRTSNKETASKGKPKEQIREEGIVQDEIILVIALVAAALLFISNLGIGGKIGNLVSGFLFGFMGFMAYLLPFALFFGTAFYISNYGNRSAKQKLICSIVLVLAITGLMQLISTPGGTYTLGEYYKDSMETKTGGGFLGGMLVLLLYNGFGLAGSYIILIALILISVTMLSQKAILTHLAKQSKNSLHERREYQKIRREQAELGDVVYTQEVLDRKPPKTFIIDPEMAVMPENHSSKSRTMDKISLKDKKNYKDFEKPNAKEEPLPVINLDHLFPAEKETENQSTPVLTYEDELKSKFGKKPAVDIDFAKEASYDKDKFNINHLQSTKVEHTKQPSSAVGIDINNMDDPLEEEKYDMGIPNPSTGVEYGYSVHSKEYNNEEMPSDLHNNSLNSDSSLSGKEITRNEAMGDINSGIRATKKETVRDDTPVESLKIEQTVEQKEYRFPSLDLLSPPKVKTNKGSLNENHLKETAIKLQTTLESFGVHVTITNVSCGPTVTRYELQPEQGVKVKSITSLADDIKLSLAAAEVRIEAPIPGKSAVGIEVPNKENSVVTLREILESSDFVKHSSDIAFSVGKDIGGQTIVTDIAKMPHLLIAGATGSGKSVCINTLIMSILYKANPADVRLIMVDPKVVELSVYNGIPHLLIPVVTDPKKASAALNWAVMEMTERYKKFADYNVRDLKGYNEKIKEVAHLNDPTLQKLPQIIIIIDELADLMMVAPGEVEDAICRLAQLARAAGIHLVIATQRPSVNVITGLIKANVPSRIAFAVSSAIDSRTILDGGGAEKLLGRGDMLFFPSGYPKPVRVQGAFVSDKEVGAVVDFLKNNNEETTYNEEVNDKISNARIGDGVGGAGSGNDRDDYFVEAGKFIIEKDKASIGMLQRVYKIGFNRAARIMDQLADAGVVGPEEGTKPRKVLMSIEDFENYLEENG